MHHICNIVDDTDGNIAGDDLRDMGHIHRRTHVPLEGDHMLRYVHVHYNLEVGCNFHHNNMVALKSQSNDRM